MSEYWKMKIDELFSSLNSSEKGLSSKEAKVRLIKYGTNEIDRADRKTPLRIFISQFENPLIYILIGATIIAFFMSDVIEALIILAILIINAILGFTQEYRSEKALDELRKYISRTTRVVRDGQIIEIRVSELVPGDIILIAIGDIVPADARLIEVHDLESNESVLTGESNPIQKQATPLNLINPATYELSNFVFMGATISAGAGKAIVISIGKDTFLGKSAQSLKEPEAATDFEKSIRIFGNMLVKVVLGLTVFVFIVNAILGHGMLEAFLFALAIAVGIAPELLPIIITIGLSHGAMGLVRKHVVVKRLEAIEDLGNIDILCADKTGTLTENQVTLIRYLDFSGKDDETILTYSLLCNSAVVHHGKVKGGTIDSAIWSYALSKFDLSKTKHFTKIDEVPFDYERKRMSVVVTDIPSKSQLLITKGAPEAMLSICSKLIIDGIETPIAKHIPKLDKMVENFGLVGYRTIVVAYRQVKPNSDYIAEEKELTFLGFLILMDPPKKDARLSLEHFQKLGVRIYILTGDGPFVTAHVCEAVGIENKNSVILQGIDIAKMDDKTLLASVETHNIFARLAPADKLRVVKALRTNGHIVGFMGDGINDAPALKEADVGISVDSGADIAKEAADVVLLRKNLEVVANGISEGRKTFGNIIKYINNTISANFGNMFTLTISSMFLPFIPLLPAQILLNNLISDVPMLTISTDNVDKEELKSPKRWNIDQIVKFMLFFGVISSVFDLLTMALVFFVIGADAAVFRTVWFLESVLSEMYVVFAIRTTKPFYKSIPSRLLILATIGATMIALAVIFPPLAPLFEFAPLSIQLILLVLSIVFAYVVVVEIAKIFFYTKVGDPNHNKVANHKSHAD